jgi:hypothetical protein
MSCTHKKIHTQEMAASMLNSINQKENDKACSNVEAEGQG